MKRAFPAASWRLIVVLMLSSTAATASAADSILLKPKLDADAVYVEFSTDAEQSMPGPDGKPMQVLSKSIYGLMMKTAAKGDGIEVSATFDRLYGSMAFGSGGTAGIKSLYDTDDPESDEASPEYRAAFDPMLNAPIRIALDAQGVATAVAGADAVRAKLLALGEQNFIAKSLADEEFTDAQVRLRFGEAPLVLLPFREVKAGETWTKTRVDEYPQVGKVIVNYECTLERIEKADDGDVAIVRFKGTMIKDPVEQPTADKRLGKIDGTFAGTARFSAAQGRFVELQHESKARIEVPPFWTKAPEAPLTPIDARFQINCAVSTAAERARRKEELAKTAAEARARREAEEAAAMSGPVEPPTPENAPVAWLQWGGPNRDFRSDATGLANHWPTEGPPKLWERPLGDGFSSILCDGDALYTMYSLRDKDDPFKGDEVAAAIDAKTGKTLWEHRYAAPWPKDLQMEFGAGPHSTPLLVGNRLFTVGSTAQLFCLDKKTGKVIWTKDLLGEFKAAMNMYGFGSSPLAHNGNILLPVSGEKGHAVMAFAQSDGAVAWKGGDFHPGYASLLRIDVGGLEHLVAFTGTAVCGLDSTNGTTLWSVDHPTQFGANISTPVWSADDQHLFVASAYGMGARGVKLERSGDQVTAKEVWANNKMRIQHGNAVRIGDWVYGSSGDFGPAFLTCLNAKTGELGWRQRGIAKATVVYADGKLILLDEDGTLLLFKADPAAYRVLAKTPGICAKTAWTAPTLYGRTLFVRDRAKIMALDLGVRGAP